MTTKPKESPIRLILQIVKLLFRLLQQKLLDIWINLVASIIFAGIAAIFVKQLNSFDILESLGIGLFFFVLLLTVTTIIFHKTPDWPEEHTAHPSTMIAPVSPSNHVGVRDVEPKDSLKFTIESIGDLVVCHG